MDQKKIDRALEIVAKMGCEKTREIIRQMMRVKRFIHVLCFQLMNVSVCWKSWKRLCLSMGMTAVLFLSLI